MDWEGDISKGKKDKKEKNILELVRDYLGRL